MGFLKKVGLVLGTSALAYGGANMAYEAYDYNPVEIVTVTPVCSYAGSMACHTDISPGGLDAVVDNAWKQGNIIEDSLIMLSGSMTIVMAIALSKNDS